MEDEECMPYMQDPIAYNKRVLRMHLTVAEVTRRIEEYQHMKESYELLLEAVKKTYVKHHMGMEYIGWDELSQLLLEALDGAIGSTGIKKLIVEANMRETERL